MGEGRWKDGSSRMWHHRDLRALAVFFGVSVIVSLQSAPCDWVRSDQTKECILPSCVLGTCSSRCHLTLHWASSELVRRLIRHPFPSVPILRRSHWVSGVEGGGEDGQRCRRDLGGAARVRAGAVTGNSAHALLLPQSSTSRTATRNVLNAAMLSACFPLRKTRSGRRLLTCAKSSRNHSQAETSWQHAIRTKNPSVNALVYTAPSPPTQLDGMLKDLTIAVKDNICTKEMPTTCSSHMLRDFTSPFDATVVSLLGSAGATIVGKANCDEFGMGSLNVYSVHGPVVNPRDVRKLRSAGGSSGGSAAAVAAGMCDAALGTDTGGSTRLPAAYCGVVGLKPSYGLISRWGVVSFADSLDCVGVLGKDVSSTQRVYDILAVHDPKDPTASRPETRRRAREACEEEMYPWASCKDGDFTGLRIGIPQEYFPTAIDPAVVRPLRRTLRALQKRGAELVPVSLPQTRFALSAYYVLASAEASSNLARYDGVRYGLHVPPPPGSPTHASALTYAHSRTRGFGPEVRKRILLGTYALTADAFDNYFLQAQRVRKLIREDFTRAFRVPDPLAATSRPAGLALPSEGVAPSPEQSGVHVLMHPSAIRTAPPLPAEGAEEGGESLDAYVQDVLTVPASLAGVPALSVPVPGDEEGDGWPVGVSVVGQWGCEDMVLRVGRAIEEVVKDLRV